MKPIDHTFQSSSDLKVCPSIFVPSASETVDGVVFTISAHGSNPDTVSAKIPSGTAPKRFMRLSGDLVTPLSYKMWVVFHGKFMGNFEG